MDELILIVEDDVAVAEGLRMTLRVEGWRAESFTDGRRALEWMASHQPDLVVADIMMPGMNGYQFFQRVRGNPDWQWIPFVFLTAKAELEDIRYGRELGADDYLTKPIEPDDLIAAVRGRLARYQQLEASARRSSADRPLGRFQIAVVVVDLGSHQVSVDGQEVRLSPTEFGILQRLLLAGGAAVDYDDLMGHEEEDVLDIRDTAELLRYHIRNLRSKLAQASATLDIIENVRGVGYRLNQPVSQL